MPGSEPPGRFQFNVKQLLLFTLLVALAIPSPMMILKLIDTGKVIYPDALIPYVWMISTTALGALLGSPFRLKLAGATAGFCFASILLLLWVHGRF